MRAVIISRMHNCYRISTSLGYNGFTYTEGAARDGVANNAPIGRMGFKFEGAPAFLLVGIEVEKGITKH